MQQSITRDSLLENFDLLDAFQQSTVFTYIESFLRAKKTREKLDKSALLELSVWAEEDIQNIGGSQKRTVDITHLIESAQYVTNYHGQQTAVMLPIDVWDRLLEVLQNGEEQIEGIENGIIDEDDGIPSVAEVVARIKATPPNPAMIRQATGSVEDLTPSDPDAEFDLEAWERDWGTAMEEVRRTDYIAYRNKGRI